ncbi:putative DNA-binding transcriptional regulator AlpA [Micromonospora sp. A200]|uniref:helix-turn-helix transcriptional regulator n=1 Tax=Micromonospora sp. A200 TaxID=2940568 RepID=UPI00247328C8|nr:helix-turn-helix domain-containing protein [Micromonospora sp. A200]MDH6461775.1 putative DNA-binding transcriptional regulator AlpA [Micromonospora sp. A200]
MGDRQPLATPEEVAQYMQKPVRTLEQWRYRGIGPRFSKVGRDVRYRWSDVEKWLDQQRAAAA